MQQDCVKATNNSESKLLCEVHPDNELQILYFGEKSYRKSRMLCVQCIIESNTKGENLNQIVYLNNFLIDQKNTIMKIPKINKDQNQQNISINLDEIDKLMLQFEEIIKNQLVKIKENIQYLRIKIQQIREEMFNELKLNDVVKQIQLLKQMDSFQGTNELKINQILLVRIQIKYKVIRVARRKIFQISNIQTILSLQIIKNDIENTQKKLIDNLKQLDLFEGVEDIKDFPEIHKQISEGQKIEYELLYQGTRDGLNGQAYWTKCNLEQNLLTIMTSKNGNKFGGYSPCQINSQLQSFVQDPTMKSFIFQYNKKEIYKLRNKEHAIYCYASYGPTYGGGCDIHVNQDFQNGHSHTLGTTYDISGYNIIDKSNHIFGAASPQLQECKVYKVIFK